MCVMEVEAVNTADVGLQVRQMQQTWEALSLKYSMLEFIHGPALAALYVGAMVSATCRCGWADAGARSTTLPTGKQWLTALGLGHPKQQTHIYLCMRTVSL